MWVTLTVCLTGRVLTAVLESQEDIVRAIDVINDRLDQLIGILKNLGEEVNSASLPLYMV